MPVLPSFTSDGLLPPGDYVLTLDELRASVLVSGPQPPREDSHWDATWRQELVGNLGVLVGQLWQVGITEIFVNGSFVEDKDHPNDTYAKRQLPMWHRYRVDLYPHVGQLSGILDSHGHELEFPAAFRRSRRDGQPKGIIKVGGHR